MKAIYLRKGKRLAQIEPSQCAGVMALYKGDKGASELPSPEIPLYNDRGERIGEISYNGKVWVNNKRITTEGQS